VVGGDEHYKALNIGVVGQAPEPAAARAIEAPVEKAEEPEQIGKAIADALRSMPAPVVNVTTEKPRSKKIERNENGDISRIVEE
jgi:hypothetical protein